MLTPLLNSSVANVCRSEWITTRRSSCPQRSRRIASASRLDAASHRLRRRQTICETSPAACAQARERLSRLLRHGCPSASRKTCPRAGSTALRCSSRRASPTAGVIGMSRCACVLLFSTRTHIGEGTSAADDGCMPPCRCLVQEIGVRDRRDVHMVGAPITNAPGDVTGDVPLAGLHLGDEPPGLAHCAIPTGYGTSPSARAVPVVQAQLPGLAVAVDAPHLSPPFNGAQPSCWHQPSCSARGCQTCCSSLAAFRNPLTQRSISPWRKRNTPLLHPGRLT